MCRKAAILALLALQAAAVGQVDTTRLDLINVDFTVGWGGCYRPMEWTPLLVGISTPFKKPVDCVVRISAPQDDLTRLNISRRVVLMPGRPMEIPLVTRFAFATDQCRLTLSSPASGLYWTKAYDIWQQNSRATLPKALDAQDVLIGVTGRQGFGVMRIASGWRGRCEGDSESGEVLVKYRFQRNLPVDWTGYASLDLLLLYDCDWVQLSDHQARAILRYVRNGGAMLLVLGANPLPGGHPFARALPFRVEPPEEAVLPRGTVRAWGARRADGDVKVSCWRLAGVEQARLWQSERLGASRPLAAVGPVGFGRVGVVAFDPAAIDPRAGKGTGAFWMERISGILPPRRVVRSNEPSSDSDRPWDYSFEPGPAHMGANAVLEYLYAVEQLRPIHIGWVVLVLAVLAVLIGPVDYLLLKRLGRLPLTWVTSSAYIALFSLGAYYGVQYLRGGVLQGRVVSVVDGIRGQPGAFSTRYVGIFSPRSAEYRLTGVDSRQWWSAMAPVQQNIWYSGRQELGEKNLYCRQHIDGGNVPVGVPINIWSLQCLLAEAPEPKMPFDATVTAGAGGEYTVEVRNAAEAPIRGGYLLLAGHRRAPFGAVPAGAVRRFTTRARPGESWQSYADRVFRDEQQAVRQATRWKNQTPFVALGTRRRTEGILRYLRDGAVAVCVEFDADPVPFGIEERTCIFQHTSLARLVVLPEKG